MPTCRLILPPRKGSESLSERPPRIKGWGSLAQPPPVPPPASHPSPTDPVLRANPCPEVTDPICRLPLPTLFYRLEAVHLGDLLRISVRPGTRITPSPQDFQGPTAVHRTPQEARCFTGPTSLSPGEPIPGRWRPLQRKENSSRDYRQRLLVRLRCRTGPPRREADLRVRVREY